VNSNIILCSWYFYTNQNRHKPSARPYGSLHRTEYARCSSPWPIVWLCKWMTCFCSGQGKGCRAVPTVFKSTSALSKWRSYLVCDCWRSLSLSRTGTLRRVSFWRTSGFVLSCLLSFCLPLEFVVSSYWFGPFASGEWGSCSVTICSGSSTVVVACIWVHLTGRALIYVQISTMPLAGAWIRFRGI